MGMSAISIIPDPMCRHAALVQLSARVGVYLHLLPPLRHTCEIWLLACKMLKRCDITKNFGEASVLHPSGMVCCLCPQSLQQSTLDQKGLDTLHEPPV